MKFSLGILFCLCQLFCCVRAAIGPPNTVEKTIELALKSGIDDTDARGMGYYVNMTVGTPGQSQTFLIDTGSSDTILSAMNSSSCTPRGCFNGQFNPNVSSTFETTHPGALKIAYLDGSQKKGDLVTDVVQMNNVKIRNFPVGLAYRVKDRFLPNVGIMGLGYSSNMAHVLHSTGVKNVSSFVEALVQAGAISSRFYSIYLNALDLYGSLDPYGSILFGGIDTNKYKGPLTTLNLLPSASHNVSGFYLHLVSVTMQPYNGPNQTIVQTTKDTKFFANLDTGTPDWVLPTSAYHKLIGYAGVVSDGGYYPGNGMVDKQSFVKPCSNVARGIDNTTRLKFTFTGHGIGTATLQVELADLFTPLTYKDGSAVTNQSGQAMCWLRVTDSGATDTQSSEMLIGGGVFRAGYWVFDLDNGQVSVAQANLDAHSPNVVPVEAGADGLSLAMRAADSSTGRRRRSR
ncbi:acid protease [Aureobasidium sp. EXF-10728]|nr:acid protease [Aureobasidium sp. EXF-10728]